MDKYGFKELTPENWLTPDPASTLFVGRALPDFPFEPFTGEEWVQDLLQPKLDENVPTEVQELFEVARGTLMYGYFFYPLYTLGWEQLFRVGEAAITHKCDQLGMPKPKRGTYIEFAKRIDWLIQQGIIPQSNFVRWDALRELRNITSHPTRQSLIRPAHAIRLLELLVADINSLFPKPS